MTMNRNSIYIDKFKTTITFKNRFEDYQREFYTNLLNEIKNQLLLIEDEKTRECKNSFSLELESIINLLPKKKRKFSVLKEEIKALKSNLIDFEKEGEYFFSLNLMSYCSIIKNDNFIVIEIPRRIIKVLLRPESNALIDLVVCKGFKSKYFIPMYDLLMTDESKEIFSLTLEELKRELYINPSQYTSFWTLKTKVIKPVLKELNNFSKFSFKEIKDKNKIVGVIFKRI